MLIEIMLIVEIVLLVLMSYLFWKLSRQPLLEDLQEEVDDISSDLDKLGTDLEVYIADMYDRIEGVLKPINKRLATRAVREEEKDINTGETTKRTGLMSGNDIKRYGINSKS